MNTVFFKDQRQESLLGLIEVQALVLITKGLVLIIKTCGYLMEFSRCSLSANSIDVHQETERNGIPTDDFWMGVLC